MKPEDLLALARSDPQEALRLGRSRLEEIDANEHSQRAVLLRGLGIAARIAGTMKESIAYAERASVEADAADDDVLRVETMLHLAGSLAMAGDSGMALTVLENAETISAGHVRGRIWFQRGMIYTTAGETASALDSYAHALPLARRAHDMLVVGATLQNRGLLHIYTGELGRAQSDLLAARRIHEASGNSTAVAGVDHNLGLLAWYEGDIPEALRRLTESERQLMALSGATTPVHASRCEVLISAGLFTEAHSLAGQIAASNRDHGLGEHEADALLVAAEAALLMGGHDEAIKLADAAAELFHAQGRGAWQANSERVSIEAEYATGRRSKELRLAALRVAEALQRDRLLAAGAFARILAGRIALDLGAISAGAADLDEVARIRKGPVGLMIQTRLAAALVRRARHDRRGALAAALAGSRLIEDHQAAIGASDLRAGIERRGAELGEIALMLAVDSGKARLVFRWMERTRARALRFRPVSPVNDSAQAADLAALRQISSQFRTVSGAERTELRRRAQALQQSIKDRSRGTGAQDAVTTVSDLAAAVADKLGDRALVEFAVVEGALWAVVVRNRRFSLRRLGTAGDVVGELTSLRFALRLLTKRGGETSRAMAIAQRVDDLLFSELEIGEGPLIVVPTAQMYSTPWSILVSLRGRPLTVAPSAEMWIQCTMAPRRRGAVVVIGGPDLAMSATEVVEVARVHGTASVWSPAEAMVEEVTKSIDGARIAHIACHAFFQSENPMFSSVRLIDGDLNVYDIERVKRAPSMMVLSACDSGFTETRVGEELIGLSSALLSMGTRTVVASVGLVPDSTATKDLMVALHRGLRAGLTPSVALHRAQTEVSDTPEGYIAASSFICIGAG